MKSPRNISLPSKKKASMVCSMPCIPLMSNLSVSYDLPPVTGHVCMWKKYSSFASRTVALCFVFLCSLDFSSAFLVCAFH